MKKTIFVLFFSFILIALSSQADITANYDYPSYAGFEERAEANGYVVIYGDSAYGTSIGLSGTLRHNGDSALVCFMLRQNCPTNQVDSCYLTRNPHRCYVNNTARGFRIGTTNIIGNMMPTPAWFQVWFYMSNIRLHSHGPGLIDDWFSLLTVTPDTTDNGDSVVTINIDSLGYVYLQQVPLFGQQIHTYQASPANDPNGKKRATQGQWHLLQVFYDTRVTHSATVWVDGKLHSAANVTGREQGVAHFHFGMYASPACSTGTYATDEQFAAPVYDITEGMFLYMRP